MKEKSALHSFVEEFRDTVFMYMRRSLGEKGVDPANWTAELLRKAAEDLVNFKRERVHVSVVPGSRSVSISTRSPRGVDIHFDELECVDVVFIALVDSGDAKRDYIVLTLAEGGLAIVSVMP